MEDNQDQAGTSRCTGMSESGVSAAQEAEEDI